MTSHQTPLGLGQLTCTATAHQVLREAGISGLFLLQRHLTGDHGRVTPAQLERNRTALNGGPELDVVSQYPCGEVEVVVITRYPHTPGLRWTDLCLPAELDEAEAMYLADDDIELLDEVELVIIETQTAGSTPAKAAMLDTTDMEAHST